MSDDQADPGPLSASVEDDQAGARLDRFLADAFPDISRARITAMIQAGAVARESGGAVTPSYRIKPGESYNLELPEPIDAEPMPEDIPVTVIYEDDSLIVIDKPAGMTVHPAPGQWTGTLVNALLHHCGQSLSGIGGVKRPGIVHRIDKDTSGLLVVAKTDLAHQGLSKQFVAHTAERAYNAIVWGKPAPASGTIEGAIGRDPRNRKRMAVVHSGGKDARTHYTTRAASGLGAALLECRLETGRTHQIRVHMAESSWPLIGDPLYGRVSKARRARLDDKALDAAQDFRRQALHAATLGFIHPLTAETLQFESPLPDDMDALLKALGVTLSGK
jgi:23S rRNA pseudouridine1911/1915/1917 synthase